MPDDPAFYKPFSELVEETIRAFHEHRISEAEYLQSVQNLGETLPDRSRARFPAILAAEPIAQAFYGLLRPALETSVAPDRLDEVAAQFALESDKVIRPKVIVNWHRNEDLQKQLRIRLDEIWFDLAKANGFKLSGEAADALAEEILDVAKRRYNR